MTSPEFLRRLGGTFRIVDPLPLMHDPRYTKSERADMQRVVNAFRERIAHDRHDPAIERWEGEGGR